MMYKVLIYVALVALTIQVAVSSPSGQENGSSRTVSRSSGSARAGPCPCKKFNKDGVCLEKACPCPGKNCSPKTASSASATACECKKFDKSGKCIDENCACGPNGKCVPKNKAPVGKASATPVRGTRPTQTRPLATRGRATA